MRKSAIVGLVLGTALLAGCSSSGSEAGGAASAEGDLPLIATTVSPITSIAAAVGGDRVAIEGIVPEGTNSHTFEPAPQVAELLSAADLILVNGLKLEDPTLDLAEANKKSETNIVEIGTEVIPESDYIYDFSFPKEEGKPNPHLWTDPLYAIEYAAVIRDELSKLDPDNATYYADNYTAFEAKAAALADTFDTIVDAARRHGLRAVALYDGEPGDWAARLAEPARAFSTSERRGPGHDGPTVPRDRPRFVPDSRGTERPVPRTNSNSGGAVMVPRSSAPAANFTALFKSIEADQIRRGVV